MTELSPRPLRVFLCHAKEDKSVVREIYRKFSAEGWIDPWLDEEKLFPGQDWDMEIEKAVEAADAVIVCLSKSSVTKEGYVQRELRFVLDIALTKPEETIFIIPLRLEDCETPRRLRAWQYADYFPVEQRERAYQRLLYSLQMRASSLGILTGKPKPPLLTLGGMEFVRIPAGAFMMGSKEENALADINEKPQHTVDIPYDYWAARFPIINEGFAHYASDKILQVVNWQEKPHHPVNNVFWPDAIFFYTLLNSVLKSEVPLGLILRMPTEAEWEKAARGLDGREWPWGNEFTAGKCNSKESGIEGTTPVGLFSPIGDSPYGCADMVGNNREWTQTIYKSYPYEASDGREEIDNRSPHVLRGGSFSDDSTKCRTSSRMGGNVNWIGGLRLVIAPLVQRL